MKRLRPFIRMATSTPDSCAIVPSLCKGGKCGLGKMLGATFVGLGLFVTIGMIGYHELAPGGLCLAALYLTPFLLGLIINRLWAAWVSPLAHLGTIPIWAVVDGSDFVWRDVGPMGWAIQTLFFVIIPMFVAFGLGCFLRQLVSSHNRKHE